MNIGHTWTPRWLGGKEGQTRRGPTAPVLNGDVKLGLDMTGNGEPL